MEGREGREGVTMMGEGWVLAVLCATEKFVIVANSPAKVWVFPFGEPVLPEIRENVITLIFLF